jgi:hypothetical protein
MKLFDVKRGRKVLDSTRTKAEAKLIRDEANTKSPPKLDDNGKPIYLPHHAYVAYGTDHWRYQS